VGTGKSSHTSRSETSWFSRIFSKFRERPDDVAEATSYRRLPQPLPDRAAWDVKEAHMLLGKVLLLAVSIGASALAAPPAAGAPERTISPLARVVRTLVRDGAPGALVVVRTPTGIHRAASGLASREPRAVLRATDRFRVASITKPFVATLALQLVAEGKLRLDESVDRWLPGLVPNGDRITIRQLLSHTSGLFEYQRDEGFVSAVIADPAREWSPRELVRIATAHPPLFPPGTGWSYSNTNYVLLGLVVEAVTGKTIDQQLRERIFDPLALAATSFPAGTGIEGEHAQGYIGFATLPSLPFGTLMDVTSVVSPSIGWAAGGIVSNGDDLTKFFSALLGGRLLRPDLLTAMRTVAPGSDYGLGLLKVQTRCGRAFGHLGDGPGYRTVAYASPNGRRVVVVMVNVDATYVSWFELERAAETAFCSSRRLDLNSQEVQR
jgi:D-alanyl-D-alanine carboxypeptidase